jgi:hypothetical protein
MNTPTNHRSRVMLLALPLLALCSPQLQAQNPPSPASNSGGDYVLLTFYSVIPNRAAEFERLQKEELNPALKKAGVTLRFASTRAVVGDNYAYVFGRVHNTLAELDAPDPVFKALGDAGARALIGKLRACQTAARNVVVRNIPDLCWGLESPMPMYMVTTIQLVNGKKAEWLKYQREHLTPAMRQTGIPTYLVQETTFGGSSNQVFTLAPFDRFADLETTRLRRHIGDDAYAKLMAKRPSTAVVDIERSLWRNRPDLSIIPPASSKSAE